MPLFFDGHGLKTRGFCQCCCYC